MTIVYPTVYTLSGNEYIVGTDDINTKCNALPSGRKEILEIPKFHENLPVAYLGKSAFYRASEFVEIRIKARIKEIRARALSDLINLKSINIPSSVERIEDTGLQFCESGVGATSGVVYIYFEPKSKLSYAGSETFGFKQSVVVYFNEKTTFTCHDKFLSSTSNAVFFAPSVYTFCGKYQTTFDPSLINSKKIKCSFLNRYCSSRGSFSNAFLVFVSCA